MRISDWSSDVCSSDLIPKSASCQASLTDALHAPEFPQAFHTALRSQTTVLVAPERRFRQRRLQLIDANDTALNFIGKSIGQFHAVGQGVCRSEEHTSELQSLMRISYAVFCLKQKNQ